MKNRLLELRKELKDIDLPVADRYKMILLQYNLYSCFKIAIEEDFDLSEYKVSLLRATLYYLSAPFTNYENRISFVKSFYESYIMFDHESIISSVTDPTSILYDDSIESYLARAYAIADVREQLSCKDLFDTLEDSLQKEKNVI